MSKTKIGLIEETIAATPFLQGYEAPQSVRDSPQPAPERNHAS